MSDQDLLGQSRLDRLNDLLRLDELAQDQLDYLNRLDEVKDPLTDDVECDTDDHPEGTEGF